MTSRSATKDKYTLGQVLYRAVVWPLSKLIRYEEYVVEKVTNSGAWVLPKHEEGTFSTAPMERRWVSERGKWCSATKADALKRLEARTASYVRHCRRRLKDAEDRARVLGLQVGDPFKPILSIYEY